MSDTKKEINIGDTVKLNDFYTQSQHKEQYQEWVISSLCAGMIGVVRESCEVLTFKDSKLNAKVNVYGIHFFDFNSGHNLNGLLDDCSGWRLPETMFDKIDANNYFTDITFEIICSLYGTNKCQLHTDKIQCNSTVCMCNNLIGAMMETLNVFETIYTEK